MAVVTLIGFQAKKLLQFILEIQGFQFDEK
jgi:hypothetical protein